MKKVYKFFILVIIFFILNYFIYWLIYRAIQDYIFPFRFEDDWDLYIKSVLLWLVISIMLSWISIYLFKKLLFNEK